MHICLVIGDRYPPQDHGGVGTYAYDLGNFLVSKGHFVTCICSAQGINGKETGQVSEDVEGVTVIRIPKPSAKFPVRMRAIVHRLKLSELVRKVDKKRKIDILEFEDGGGLLAYRKLPQTKKVVRLHATTIYNEHELGRPPSRMMHLFEKKSIRRADQIISATDYVAMTTLSLMKLEKDYTKLPLGIDTELFSPNAGRKSIPGLVLFTGAVAPRKGVFELILAMKIVLEKKPEAELWLAGNLPENKETDAYFQRITSAISDEYQDRIRFLGPIPRESLPDLISKAEICCFPSRSETFGLGIIEAMSMAKPTIYMQKQPGPEIIVDGESGRLCDTTSPGSIANAIVELLDEKDLASQFGLKARERAITKFEKNTCLQDQLAFYEDILKEDN